MVFSHKEPRSESKIIKAKEASLVVIGKWRIILELRRPKKSRLER